jgi:hypothetical protein
MANSSAHLGFTEGIGVRKLATYRFSEDGVDKDVERIAPGCGVLQTFASALGVNAVGKVAATEIPCAGKARIIVKARSATGAADSMAFVLVYKAFDGSIIGPTLLSYSQFSTVQEDGKALATAMAFSNDVCASSVYIHLLTLPASSNVDLFIAAV